MTQTIELTTYSYSELSEQAQEKALNDERYSDTDNFWSKHVLEMFAEQIEKEGVIELATRSVPLMGGGTRQDPVIYWSVSYSQGDGACFAGRLRVAEWLRNQKVAGKYRALYNAAKEDGFYVRIRHSGNDTHEGTMHLENEYGYTLPDRAESQLYTLEDDMIEYARDKARQLHKDLVSEYEYQTSDSEIASRLEDMDYRFTEDGKMI